MSTKSEGHRGLESSRVQVEALAALGDLLERSRGGQQPLYKYGFSGMIEDFPVHFLAWATVVRSLDDRYGISDSLSTALECACGASVNDSAMAKHFDEVAEVLAALEHDGSAELEERLREFDFQVPAMQMVILTTQDALRTAAHKSGKPEVVLIEETRAAFSDRSRGGASSGTHGMNPVSEHSRSVDPSRHRAQKVLREVFCTARRYPVRAIAVTAAAGFVGGLIRTKIRKR